MRQFALETTRRAYGRVLLACFAVLVSFATTTHAILAPAKPSDIVTLSSDGTTCSGSGLLINTKILPDGTAEPFVIPAKKVLVVTELEWGATSLPVSKTFDFYLFLQVPPSSALPIVSSSALADASGHAGGEVQVQNAVVKPGPELCAIDFPGSTSIFLVRGFLAKDA